MEKHLPMLFLVSTLAAVGVAAFAYYRWRQRRRNQRVKDWITGYLRDRFGEPLERLTINCSDDPLWPVLVGFDDLRTGLRHRLQFSCPGLGYTISLLSEEKGKR